VPGFVLSHEAIADRLDSAGWGWTLLDPLEPLAKVEVVGPRRTGPLSAPVLMDLAPGPAGCRRGQGGGRFRAEVEVFGGVGRDDG